MSRRRMVYFGTALLAVAALIAWGLWQAGAPPQSRARVYGQFTACLLTDDQGITGPVAAQAWNGLQDASLSTHAKIQYVAVVGPETESNAEPFLTSLVQRQCGLVIAVGPAEAAAVDAIAPRYPSVRFAVVGTGTAQVTTIASGTSSDIRSAVGTFLSTVDKNDS